MSLDLSSLDTVVASDKGARIELRHPTTNTPLGVFVTVLGKHSQVFRDHIRTMVNERIRKETLASRRGKNVEPKLAEDVESDGIQSLVLCTLGWETESKNEADETVVVPTLSYKGEDLPFSVQNAITVYTNLIWVREQIDEAIGDLENFM